VEGGGRGCGRGGEVKTRRGECGKATYRAGAGGEEGLEAWRKGRQSHAGDVCAHAL